MGQIVLQRRPDWRPRLADFIGTVSHRTFRFGQHDCALFAAGAVEVMTGHDLARGLRGYRTKAEGLRRLRAKGYDDHFDMAAKILPETHPINAREGDLARVEWEDEPAVLGVIQGDMVYVLRHNGLGLVPRRAAVKAWAVA